MKFNTVECWLLQTPVYEIEQFANEQPDLRLIKKSILKNGYRAYGLDERIKIEAAIWYKNFLLGEKVLFYVDGSGIYKLANIDLTENEFYFERDSLPIGYRPWVFFSWQSDHNPSRSHIKEALLETIQEVNDNRRPKEPLEIVESTRPEDGAKDITDAIKRNLDLCLIAIFDITNVADVNSASESNSKSYPNANVVFEMSYALHRKRDYQIILVRHEREDIKSLEVPFDFRQNRHLSYKKPALVKEQIKKVIIQTLEKMGYLP